MKLHQLRYLCEVVDRRFNITDAARALHTSQPGVSKQIRQLESELGVEVLAREGNRIVGLTEPGEAIVGAARRVLADARELGDIAAGFNAAAGGSLAVATTHVHARYPLLPVITAFAKAHPEVRLSLFEGSPADIAERVLTGRADVGITTGPLEPQPDLVMLPAYRIGRSLITPPGHPLLKLKRLTLAAIARFPLIVYDASFSSGWTVSQAFEKARVAPNVVLSATDADVIKAYVAAGLGVALLQSLAYDAAKDVELRAVRVDHLVPPSTTHVMLRRGKFLRTYVLDFIATVASDLNPQKVRAALRAAPRVGRGGP